MLFVAATTLLVACSGAEGPQPASSSAPGTAAAPGARPPAEVRAVTVVAFQDLKALEQPDSGEAHWWYTDGGLDVSYGRLGDEGAIYGDADASHLLLVTGEGKSNSAASVVALGADPRFDLRRAYWIEAGIGGGDPERTTIGAAVWEDWIVDGEVSAQIDPRQLDQQYFAMELGCTDPPFCPGAVSTGTQVFQLDEALLAAAIALGGDVVLEDPASVAAMRAPYPQPAAQAAPSIQRGSLFGGDTFTHGSLLSGQMAWWVSGMTDGRGTYTVTANEEPAVATAVHRLAAAGRADATRYAVVRSPSNFDQEHPGQTALESLAVASSGGQPEGEALALRNCYLAASAVTRDIVTRWDAWRDGVPAS